MDTMRSETRFKRKSLSYCCVKYLMQIFFTIFWILQLSNLSNAEETIERLTIDEAFKLALETHEGILIAEKEVEKRKLLPKKATTIMMPRISISGGYTRLDEPIEFEPEIGGFTLPPIETVPEDQWHGNFKFSQPIYEGEFFPLKRKAQQVIESTTEDYYRVIQEVLFQVAQAYYEVLKAKELVQNARKTFDLTQEELRVSKVKFKAGDVTEDTVLRSELNFTRAQSRIIRNVNRFKLAQDIFKRLVGIETPTVHLIKPPELKAGSQSYEALINNALEFRHDYRRALLLVDIAESDIALVKTRFHPKLEASWDYFRIDDPAWLQDERYWAAAFKVKIPILEGGIRFLDLKERRENLHQAKLALKSTEENIRLDVENAMLKLQTDKSILANLTKQVELAEKNYEIIFAKFKFGAATSVDLNEALVSLDLARTEFITEKYDYQVAILSLDKAVGIFALDAIARIESKR